MSPEGVYESGRLVDISLHRNGRDVRMLGPGGAARELAVLAPLEAAPDAAHRAGTALPTLPVLLGSGLGHALSALLKRCPDMPVAVVDKEADILRLTRLPERLRDPRITWITAPDATEALTELTRWQVAHGGKAFLPLVHPFYLRLDSWYKEMRSALHASARANFWDKAVAPRFAGKEPRILLITSKYFLVGELVAACKRLGYPHRLLTLEDEPIAGPEFVENLLTAVIEFQPDCVLTMNHLGVDREGVLTDLLARLKLPLGSWFVDNPQLILHLYNRLVSPWTAIFTWDADNLPGLEAMGFEHVFHLPLGTDPERFRPGRDRTPPNPDWPSQVSFVGNSMVYKVAKRMEAGRFPAALLRGYKRLAARFGATEERSVRQFLLEQGPEVVGAYAGLPDDEARLAYEAMITWEATRQYRAACVERILPFTPLIVGDDGWLINFRRNPHPWRLHRVLSYYSELPRFYQWSAVNFNCTSKQMKGAVNQRLFDVPAAGAFLITDWREQIDALFEPGREVITYTDPAEIPELVRYYLDHPQARQAVALAARKRVLAEHTWDHRLQSMVRTLARIYR